MTTRITKSRDPILAALKASFGEAVNAMCKTVEVDDYVRAIEECDSIRDQITERGKLFRPKRVRKADRKATEFGRIVRYVAAQPASFRNHVPATGVSIANAERAAYYRAELVEWMLFTQRGVGLRKEFVAAHKEAMQWAAFHRRVAAECGRRLP